jgi:hypothetical protein
MESEEKRDITLLLAFSELHGKPVTAWDAHAALLRAQAMADHYASTDHPESTRAYVQRGPLLPRRNQ